jgi:RNA polymerase sigma-70 factor (ECF subfamily)
VHRFAEVCQLGDIAALRAAVDADAIAVCDGGGLVPAAIGRPGLARRRRRMKSWLGGNS